MSNLSQFFGGAIKSIQRGVISVAGVYVNTVTISPVNTAKTNLTFLGSSTNATTTDEALIRIELTNSTTITAYKGWPASTAYASFEVTEYY